MTENNIEKYYKDVDKPFINNLINNNLKQLLELSVITDLYIFKKKENKWKLKDKRQLLKECDNKKKYKIKEVTHILNTLSKNKISNIVNKIKIDNNNLICELEKIENFINTIEQVYPNNYIENFSN